MFSHLWAGSDITTNFFNYLILGKSIFPTKKVLWHWLLETESWKLKKWKDFDVGVVAAADAMTTKPTSWSSSRTFDRSAPEIKIRSNLRLFLFVSLCVTTYLSTLLPKQENNSTRLSRSRSAVLTRKNFVHVIVIIVVHSLFVHREWDIEKWFYKVVVLLKNEKTIKTCCAIDRLTRRRCRSATC